MAPAPARKEIVFRIILSDISGLFCFLLSSLTALTILPDVVRCLWETIEKRTLTFDKLVDYEDNIRETKALRSLYQISKDKVRLNTINMDIEDYRERISKLPSDIQQELVREKRRQLVEIVYMKTLEDLIIDKTVNVSNVNSRDPRVKAVLSYVHHKDLGEIVDYLHRLRK